MHMPVYTCMTLVVVPRQERGNRALTFRVTHVPSWHLHHRDSECLFNILHPRHLTCLSGLALEMRVWSPMAVMMAVSLSLAREVRCCCGTPHAFQTIPFGKKKTRRPPLVWPQINPELSTIPPSNHTSEATLVKALRSPLKRAWPYRWLWFKTPSMCYRTSGNRSFQLSYMPFDFRKLFLVNDYLNLFCTNRNKSILYEVRMVNYRCS